MQNPLESYRRTQRELREQFADFTRRNCPVCPTPCCRKPARIEPADIHLAQSIGWRSQRIIPLRTEIGTKSAPAAQPETISMLCEYLGESGCTFPTDLRPYGCTAFICKYMYQQLDKRALARLKRLVRELNDKHTILLRTLPQTVETNLSDDEGV